MSNCLTGTLLEKLRKDNNYTLQEIAHLLGVSKAAVSKWEAGEYITTEHLYDLAKLYNVNFSELYHGKLNYETNNDYWRRNYDLSNFELEEDINTKNVDNLKNLFDHCNMVKERFFKLLIRWAKNKLNNNEIEEFNFIKQYFEFDSKYYTYIKYGYNHLPSITDESIQKEFVLEVWNSIKDLDKESYIWELGKLFNFRYDYKSDDICKSGNLKALEYMLSTFTQIEKDSILYANLHIKEEKEIDANLGLKSHKAKQMFERDRTIDEIEHIPFFKVIINSGAHKLYQHKVFNNGWDQEMFDAIEGTVVEIDNSIYDENQFYDFGGQTFIPIINNWKLYSYKDYLKFIDKEGTEQLKDIVSIKDSDPLKYYEKMVNREYANVKK